MRIARVTGAYENLLLRKERLGGNLMTCGLLRDLVIRALQQLTMLDCKHGGVARTRAFDESNLPRSSLPAHAGDPAINARCYVRGFSPSSLSDDCVARFRGP